MPAGENPDAYEKGNPKFADMKNDRDFWRFIAILFIIFFVIMVAVSVMSSFSFLFGGGFSGATTGSVAGSVISTNSQTAVGG